MGICYSYLAILNIRICILPGSSQGQNVFLLPEHYQVGDLFLLPAILRVGLFLLPVHYQGVDCSSYLGIPRVGICSPYLAILRVGIFCPTCSYAKLGLFPSTWPCPGGFVPQLGHPQSVNMFIYAYLSIPRVGILPPS